MDAIEALLTRKSVRSFSSKPVTDEQIETLLKVMVAAPSAGNLQPWRIVVVRDPEVKRALARGALDQQFIAEAPVVFVVCRVPDASAWKYGERGRHLYSIQDTAAMTENLLVAAHAMGLGGCWVGAFDEEKVAKSLDCPQGVIPAAIVPIGYPKRETSKPARRPMKRVVRFIPSLPEDKSLPETENSGEHLGSLRTY